MNFVLAWLACLASLLWLFLLIRETPSRTMVLTAFSRFLSDHAENVLAVHLVMVDILIRGCKYFSNLVFLNLFRTLVRDTGRVPQHEVSRGNS